MRLNLPDYLNLEHPPPIEHPFDHFFLSTQYCLHQLFRIIVSQCHSVQAMMNRPTHLRHTHPSSRQVTWLSSLANIRHFGIQSLCLTKLSSPPSVSTGGRIIRCPRPVSFTVSSSAFRIPAQNNVSTNLPGSTAAPLGFAPDNSPHSTVSNAFDHGRKQRRVPHIKTPRLDYQVPTGL